MRQAQFCALVASQRTLRTRSRYEYDDGKIQCMDIRRNRSSVRCVHVAGECEATINTDTRVTRADVLRGFEEAIDLARSRSNPAEMLAGWREIAKMCGYYAPEGKEVRVNVAVSALHDEIAGMSDAELLALITT